MSLLSYPAAFVLAIFIFAIGWSLYGGALEQKDKISLPSLEYASFTTEEKKKYNEDIKSCKKWGIIVICASLPFVVYFFIKAAM